MRAQLDDLAHVSDQAPRVVASGCCPVIDLQPGYPPLLAWPCPGQQLVGSPSRARQHGDDRERPSHVDRAQCPEILDPLHRQQLEVLLGITVARLTPASSVHPRSRAR